MVKSTRYEESEKEKAVVFRGATVEQSGKRLYFTLTGPGKQFREYTIEWNEEVGLFEIRCDDHLMAMIDM